VAYANIVPVLVEAVKTLHVKVEVQQKQMDRLRKRHTDESRAHKSENAELRTKLDALTAAVRELLNDRR
jgi:hypothetical protein